MAKKITHDEFVETVNNFDINNEFVVIGNYINNETKIKIYHKECGRVFNIRPADFKRRKRCSLCNKKTKLTTKDFKDYIHKKEKDNYTLLSEYEKDSIKVMIKHNKCGYNWSVTPSHFKQGKRCPKCGGNKKKTTIQFKQELKELFGNEYKILEHYKNANEPIYFMHMKDICNHNVFKMTPSDIRRGRGCPKCSLKSRSGKNHFRYNENLTESDRRNNSRHSDKYKKWRNKIFKNYNYTCDCCGKVGGDLQAHHKSSWNIDKKNRYNISNGVLLCVSCHLNFHKEYGFGNNTEKQYLSFKNSYSCQYRGNREHHSTP